MGLHRVDLVELCSPICLTIALSENPW